MALLTLVLIAAAGTALAAAAMAKPAETGRLRRPPGKPSAKPSAQPSAEPAGDDPEFQYAYAEVEQWLSNPNYLWTFGDGDSAQAQQGQALSSWLTYVAYWQAYPEGLRRFSLIPGTATWRAESDFRDAWFRIETYIKSIMADFEIRDEPISYPGG